MKNRLTVLFLFVAFCCSTAYAQSDPAQEIKDADAVFSMVRKSMRSIPSGTLQGWASVRVVLNQLDSLAKEAEVSTELRDRADYVRAYGYHILGLYDVAAHIQKSALLRKPNTELRADLLRDLANSLEKMGEFNAAVAARKEVLHLVKPKITDHNNLAFVALKAGDYSTTIEQVDMLDSTDPDGAEARIWSARAYAYQGMYEEAERELAIACRNKIQDACQRLAGVRESGVPKAWWRVDKTERTIAWSFTNQLPDSSRLDPDMLGRNTPGAVSQCAGSPWFNEITLLHDESRMPAPVAGFKTGFLMISGYPVQTFIAQDWAEPNFEALITSQLRNIHGPSAFGGKLPFELKTRALIVNMHNGKQAAMIVHSDIEESQLRKQLSRQISKVIY